MRPVRAVTPLSLVSLFSLAAVVAAVAPSTAFAQAAVPAAAAGPQVEPSAEARAVIRDRLARSLAARSRIVLQRELVFLGVLRNSKVLMQQALALSPDNPFIWRLAIDLGAALEDGEADAARMLSDGLAKASALEPDDEVLRLRRLLDVVSRRQTAEGRIEASKALLTADAVGRIGSRVAARIAFDLALLLRRTGDSAGFEENLLRALDLDPTFPEATEVAAGYFRVHAPTALDELRALRSAALANPMREGPSLSFAERCLQEGAYSAAASMLDVTVRLQEARGFDENYDGMLADFLVALWGIDQPAYGLAFAKRRQERLDYLLQGEIEKQGMTITPEEREKIHLPVAPVLATTVAAISESMKHPGSPVAVSNAAIAFDTILEQMAKRNVPKDEMALVALQSAFTQLWLGGSLDKAQSLISRAADGGPLTESARARFDGWIALRQKDAAKAKSLLEPIAEADLPAKLGLALAHEALGEKRDAARRLLEVARATPSNAMGLWARDRLFGILGARTEIIPGAAAADEVAALPPEFTKLVRDGGASMLLRVLPRQTRVRPWDQVLFDVEVTNRSGWPLAVGPDGPIKDSVALSASIHVPGLMPQVPQIVIAPIDRQFVIGPGETLRVPVDLSITDASTSLRDDALSGAFVSLHSIINWRTTATGFEPSQIGVEVESPVVHVEGERITREWVERSLDRLRDTTQAPDPELIALLSSALVRKTVAPAMVPEDAAKALEGAGPLLADAARRVWPEARAWLVFACPKGKRIEQGQEAKDLLDVVAAGGVETAAAVPELEDLDAVLRADEDPLVRISWIAVRSRRPEDPVLVAALDAKDELTRSYAADCKQWMIEARDERAKQLNLKP
ncbi:MAG: hypothetical protein RL325_609 [Planctomycetota bacterium]